MRKNNRKGLTIVELVIVIAVIGILAGVMIPTISGVIKSAKDAADIADARSIYNEYAIEAGADIEDTVTLPLGDGNHFTVTDGQLPVVDDVLDTDPCDDANDDGKCDACGADVQ